MKKIGPSFSDELEAAGLIGLPFAWNEETGAVQTDDPNLTAAQRQRVREVVAAHDPTTRSKAQTVEQNKRQARADLLAHCALIEADATLPGKVRVLAALLKNVLGQ